MWRVGVDVLGRRRMFSTWESMCTVLQEGKAHESNGRCLAGNGKRSQRTLKRRKASRSGRSASCNGEGAWSWR